MKKIVIIVCILCCYASIHGADSNTILALVDKQLNFQVTDISQTATVVSQKPGKEDSIFKVQIYYKTKEQKVVWIILKPEVSKGTGYLIVDESLWVYDPESRKFSHNSLKENFQNTNAKNSDFKISSLEEQYKVDSFTEGQLEKFKVFIVELTAQNDTVPVPKLKLWITSDTYLVLKREEYTLSGRLSRTLYFPHYIKIQNQFMADKQLIIDNLQEGEKTQITLSNVSTARLPERYFQKIYLEEVNR